jgi:glycosyltransferase involved in cell wall biosynthesis
MKILAFNYTLPRADKSSGEKRFTGILQILARHHEVDLCIGEYAKCIHDPSCQQVIAEFEKKGIRIISREKRLLVRRLKKVTYDIGYFEFYWVAERSIGVFKRFQPGAVTIIDSVDVHFAREESQYKLGQITEEKVLATKEKELAAYRSADIVIAVSSEDQELLHDEGKIPHVFLVPNVVPMVERNFERKKPVALFIGSYKWSPNADAVRWFVKEIWPVIYEKNKEAEFFIIGSDPDKEILSFKQIPGINVLGFVPDTRPYLDMAAVSVAPLRFGGGMKGKVNEALAHGLPVVTTSIGAQGFKVENGKEMIIEDDPLKFAYSVLELFLNPEKQRQIGLAGQQLNEHICSPVVIEESLNRITGFAEELLNSRSWIPRRKRRFFYKHRVNRQVLDYYSKVHSSYKPAPGTSSWHILFMTEVSPFPPSGGERIRSYSLLKTMAKLNYQVTAIIRNENNVPPEEMDIPGIHFIPYPYRRYEETLADEFLGYFRKDPDILDLIKAIHKQNPFNVAFIDYFFLGQYISYCKRLGISVVYGTHNAQSKLRLQQPAAGILQNLVKAVAFMTQWLHERYYFKKADALIAVSEPDRKFYQKFVSKNKIYIIPNFIDQSIYQPVDEKEDYLVMTGNFSSFQNSLGIEWFVKEVWDEAISSRCRLILIGGGSIEILEHISKKFYTGSISAKGFIESINGHIARARAAIVPILHGGGTRLKCIEAMALKTQVISTTRGAEGINHEGSILIANSPGEFREKILQVMNGEVNTVENAYAVFGKKYSLASNMDKLNTIFNISRPVSKKDLKTTKILIFGHARSGTGLIKDLLNQSPLINLRGELFLHGAVVVDPFRLIREAEAAATKEIFGFKLLSYQLKQRFEDPDIFMEYLSKRGYLILHIWRENLLEIAISGLNAHIKETFRYWETDGKREDRFRKIYIDIDQLLSRLEGIERLHKLEQKVLSGIPALRIIYENDLRDENSHQATVDKICDFLNIPYHTAKTGVLKSIPLSLPEFIINYQEVEDSLRNTRFFPYFVK